MVDLIYCDTVAKQGGLRRRQTSTYLSGETTGILDTNYILIASLTERIGEHEKTPVTVNTSCRSEG